VIKAISSLVAEFTDGSSFDAVETHEWLIGVCIAGSLAVGFGILLESWPPKSLKAKIAMGLVIGGVVVEALFTILLFVFDEGISSSQQKVISAQQSKIIALETRLAPRIISEAQKLELIAKLKSFDGGLEFDAAVEIHDNEQVQLLSSLMDILTKAAWKQIDWAYAAGGITYKLGSGAGSPSIGDVASYDVEIQVRKESLDRLKPAAETLALALIAIGIASHAVVSDATTVNNANIQALHLIVGQKR
jgi:hypothetical protein